MAIDPVSIIVGIIKAGIALIFGVKDATKKDAVEEANEEVTKAREGQAKAEEETAGVKRDAANQADAQKKGKTKFKGGTDY